MNLKSSLIAVTFLALTACGGGSSSSSGSKTTSVEPEGSKEISSILRELSYSVEILNKNKEFVVNITDNDVSMLLNFQASGKDGGVFVKEVLDPSEIGRAHV